jgi:hypothetical protein
VGAEIFPNLSEPLNFPFKQPIHNAVMTSLRPLRFRRRPVTPTVESLNERLCDLTCERQQLRVNGADSVALERNRVAIAGAQWELSYALIERYLPPHVAAAAQSAA